MLNLKLIYVSEVNIGAEVIDTVFKGFTNIHEIGFFPRRGVTFRNFRGGVFSLGGTLVDRSHLGPVFKLFWNGRLILYNMGLFGLNIIYFNVFNDFGSSNHHK